MHCGTSNTYYNNSIIIIGISSCAELYPTRTIVLNALVLYTAYYSYNTRVEETAHLYGGRLAKAFTYVISYFKRNK